MNKKYPSCHNLSTEPFLITTSTRFWLAFWSSLDLQKGPFAKALKEAGHHSGCPRVRSPPLESAATSGSWSKRAMYPLVAFGNLSLKNKIIKSNYLERTYLIFLHGGGWRRPRTTTLWCVRAAANLLSRSTCTSLPTDFSRATNLTMYSTVWAAL